MVNSSIPNCDRGIVFNIQRYSLHDGDGIRTIVFMKGCPLRCAWCANPESQAANIELSLKTMHCIGCRSCEVHCPHQAIRFLDGKPTIARELCTVCGNCEQACNTGAMSLMGQEMTVEEVFHQVISDRPFFDASNGGVTFSGGEPLMQPHFLKNALRRFHEANISTVLETCGFASKEILESVQSYVDTFYFDIKLMDSEMHKKFTSVSNERILSNLAHLQRTGSRVLVRMPLIPGVNDSKENLVATGMYLKKIDIPEIQLLPYHSYGASKYPTIGRAYKFHSHVPSTEEMENARKILVGCGVKVKI